MTHAGAADAGGTNARTPSRLAALEFPAKLLVTFTLAGLGLGYAVSFLMIREFEQMGDGKPGMTVQDIQIAFGGNRNQCLLTEKLDGSMRPNLPDAKERATVLGWVDAGSTREGWPAVEPIIRSRCLKCHVPGGESEFRPYTDAKDAKDPAMTASYERVKEVCEEGKGQRSIRKILKLTHVHAFGMMFLAILLGLVAIHTGLAANMRALLVALPFLGYLTDIGGWWLTWFDPLFAPVVFLGGVIFAFSYVAISAIALREMWTGAGAAPAAGDPGARAESSPEA